MRLRRVGGQFRLGQAEPGRGDISVRRSSPPKQHDVGLVTGRSMRASTEPSGAADHAPAAESGIPQIALGVQGGAVAVPPPAADRGNPALNDPRHRGPARNGGFGSAVSPKYIVVPSGDHASVLGRPISSENPVARPVRVDPVERRSPRSSAAARRLNQHCSAMVPDQSRPAGSTPASLQQLSGRSGSTSNQCSSRPLRRSGRPPRGATRRWPHRPRRSARKHGRSRHGVAARGTVGR